jgi:hypothetical protein
MPATHPLDGEKWPGTDVVYHDPSKSPAGGAAHEDPPATTDDPAPDSSREEGSNPPGVDRSSPEFYAAALSYFDAKVEQDVGGGRNTPDRNASTLDVSSDARSHGVFYEPATVAMENFRGMSFDAISAALLDVSENISPGHADGWREVSRGILDDLNDFRRRISANEEVGGWRGDTHDAAMRNLELSYARPEIMARGAETMAVVTEYYSETMSTSKHNILDQADLYRAYKASWPQYEDITTQRFDDFAQSAMIDIYTPAILEIADRNPGFVWLPTDEPAASGERDADQINDRSRHELTSAVGNTGGGDHNIYGHDPVQSNDGPPLAPPASGLNDPGVVGEGTSLSRYRPGTPLVEGPSDLFPATGSPLGPGMPIMSKQTTPAPMTHLDEPTPTSTPPPQPEWRSEPQGRSAERELLGDPDVADLATRLLGDPDLADAARALLDDPDLADAARGLLGLPGVESTDTRRAYRPYRAVQGTQRLAGLSGGDSDSLGDAVSSVFDGVNQIVQTATQGTTAPPGTVPFTPPGPPSGDGFDATPAGRAELAGRHGAGGGGGEFARDLPAAATPGLEVGPERVDHGPATDPANPLGAGGGAPGGAPAGGGRGGDAKDYKFNKMLRADSYGDSLFGEADAGLPVIGFDSTEVDTAEAPTWNVSL